MLRMNANKNELERGLPWKDRSSSLYVISMGRVGGRDGRALYGGGRDREGGDNRKIGKGEDDETRKRCLNWHRVSRSRCGQNKSILSRSY